ncbi:MULTISPECIES: peptide chain release factor 2 [Carnobacterium]|uniref:Peptide chain release factor 2 n=1 Tax=Carnobacterium antarcticum TaxID=2126436 RepID=A0ABW4NQ15_9LACT
MEISDVRNKLETAAGKIAGFRRSLDLEAMEQTIAAYDDQMTEPTFWDDAQKAQDLINEANIVKEKYTSFKQLEEKQEELEVLLEMVKEETDLELEKELNDELTTFLAVLDQYELDMLLSGPYDKNNAIMELHPGAGGTESQDWGSMLLRMYTRWAEKKGFKVETLDYQDGDEAGIKSVTLLIKGHNAYGYLKAEKGVHRLVRISPFDSAGRRHTSFVSIDVIPELAGNVDIDINPEDLKVDTYRASGAGGQHINKTDSAVRITHIPSGVVVASQAQRSQLKNRDQAMNMLKAKLHQIEVEEKEREMAEIRGEQKEIGWGSQIRSYVFHPYTMVKDHRTNYETGNVTNVMDGDIDPFINAYLRSRMTQKD